MPVEQFSVAVATKSTAMPGGTAAERRAALRFFKQRGYVMAPKALEVVLSSYGELATPTSSLSEHLVLVGDALAQEHADGLVVTEQVANDAIGRMLRKLQSESIVDGDRLEVIDVFQLPQYQCPTAQSVPRVAPGAWINAPAEAKANVFRTRHHLILDRTLRNDRFSPAKGVSSSSDGFGLARKTQFLQLTPLDSLHATSEGEHLVLGMLSQFEDGVWFLEDLQASVRVDLRDVHTTAGLHTEGSFVIVQGRMRDNGDDDDPQPVLHATAMGTPPMESRSVSIRALGRQANIFGGNFDHGTEAAMQRLEEESTDTFLLMADVFLDKPSVMSGIRTVFRGYVDEDAVPSVIVLMGNFLSHQFGLYATDAGLLARKFAELGDLLVEELGSRLEQTTIVIVPGPADAGPGNVVPRPPMPKSLTAGLTTRMPPGRVRFATNPCRLRYLSQELVLVREDLLSKMVRHCAVRPDVESSSQMAEHMMKSIVDQGHLFPIPLTARPLLWAHDQALWLFPSPHVVVVADAVEACSFTYGETLGINPGSFGADSSFSVYVPATKTTTACTLNVDELQNPPEAILTDTSDVD